MEEIYGIAAHWAWFILAAALAIGEIAIAPGIFLIFIAGAAACVGIITAVVTISLATQLILFGILAVASVYIGRRWFQKSGVDNEDPLLNDRSARMIGETVTVIEPLTAAEGRVRHGGSEWPARGDGLAAGSVGRITSVEAGILFVEAAE